MTAWKRTQDRAQRRPPESSSATGKPFPTPVVPPNPSPPRHRWYFTLAYGDPLSNPGETVWLRAQINVLSDLGYTILSTHTYDGMISSHAAMPDVISLIWTEDAQTLTCQDDPRCALFDEFQATNERYPGTEVRENHTSPVWDEIPEDADKRPAQRWAWTWPELNALPVEERGTIPLWKLFTTTYVSCLPVCQG